MRVCAGCANRNEATALTEVPDSCEGRFDTLAGAIAHIDHKVIDISFCLSCPFGTNRQEFLVSRFSPVPRFCIFHRYVELYFAGSCHDA